MVDRYQEDTARVAEMLREINAIYKERQDLAEQKKPTGKFDYKLKSKIESVKKEINGLEKMQYLINNNDSKYEGLSSNEKSKRVKKLENMIEDFRTKSFEISAALTTKTPGGRDSSTTDEEQSPLTQTVKKDVVKGEDGEFENTRGLNNEQLLVQQQNLLTGQDAHLDKISNIVDKIKFESQNFGAEVGL